MMHPDGIGPHLFCLREDMADAAGQQQNKLEEMICCSCLGIGTFWAGLVAGAAAFYQPLQKELGLPAGFKCAYAGSRDRGRKNMNKRQKERSMPFLPIHLIYPNI